MNDNSLSSNESSNGTLTTNDTSGNGVHQLGYRGWSGVKSPGWLRSVVISAVGIKRSWKNKWLQRILYIAWLPTVWYGAGFFIWEQASLYSEWREMVMPLLRGLPPEPIFNEIRAAVKTGNFSGHRHVVWAWLIKSFIRYSQPVLMVLAIGMIAPPLISQDIRSRAFLLYFSRPLSRIEYLLGKMMTLCAYLGLITTVPGLTLYVFGVCVSPSLNVMSNTWDLPLRVLAASAVLMIPTASMALCFSSLTQESRNAGFAWFAVWILGWFTYASVSSGEAFHAQREFRRNHQIVVSQESVWTHLSLYHTLGRVQNWIFGFSSLNDVLPSITILVVITTVSMAVLYYRISAPMRV